jgi:hypothetical protein
MPVSSQEGASQPPRGQLVMGCVPLVRQQLLRILFLQHHTRWWYAAWRQACQMIALAPLLAMNSGREAVAPTGMLPGLLNGGATEALKQHSTFCTGK